MVGGCLFDNSGTTISIKCGDGTWTTLGNIDSVTAPIGVSTDDVVDAVRYNMYVKGIWDDENSENKERNDIMSVLDLYEKRKREEIANKYEKIIKKEYEDVEIVDAYNNLVKEFEINLQQLADKYNTKEETFIERTGYEPDYAFELSDEIERNIREKHSAEYNEEIVNLNEMIEEVRAVLSLSNDKDYQLDVLKNYEILDKKGRINI